MGFIISIIVSLVFAIWPLVHMLNDKKHKMYYILCFVILLVGCFVRLYLIDKYPIGLQSDEASIGYEAFSLIQHGVDRNGMSYPVNFISWGSGQNVLYAYLSIPFIKIMGLNVLSTRLVMALIGCLTLLVIYLFTRKELNHKYSLLALFMIAIMPWHIVKSRWALESNIFPDIVLYGVILLYLGIKNNKKKYYLLGSIILGISTYAYGTSYLFIPVFLVILYGYLIKKKMLKWNHALLYFSLTGIVALPMILYTFVNFFNLGTIHLGPITIPMLYVNRMASTTLFNPYDNILTRFGYNIMDLFGTVLFQVSDRVYGGIPYFGLYYTISLPIFLYGFIKARKCNHLIIKITHILFITSIILGLFLRPSSTHTNIIWFPVITYVIYGFINIIQNFQIERHIYGIYISIFLCLIMYYFTGYQDYLIPKTNYSLDDALEYSNSINYDKMYITINNQNYISYLFYNKIDSMYYIDNVSIQDKNSMFQNIDRIGNVYFSYPSQIENNIVIITSRQDKITFDCPSKEFTNYIVYVCN